MDKINLSYEARRKLLIKEGLHSPKTKKKVYLGRRRMSEEGLLVQMDSFLPGWIEGIEKQCWLVVMIDGGEGFVYAEFHPHETAMGCKPSNVKFQSSNKE